CSWLPRREPRAAPAQRDRSLRARGEARGPALGGGSGRHAVWGLVHRVHAPALGGRPRRTAPVRVSAFGCTPSPGIAPAGLGLARVGAVAAALRGRDSDAPLAVEIGLGWWLLFLIPVLPLAHHTYLYYLYIPWAGGAIGAAALGRRLLDPWPRTLARSVGCLA